MNEIMTSSLAERRSRGRPRRRFIDSINEIWNAVAQEDGTDWQVITYVRQKWEEVVLAVKILNGS